MQIPFWNRTDAHGLEWIAAVAAGNGRCVLTTRSRFGEPHARKVRISNYSMQSRPTLVFVVPKDAELTDDLRRDANVTLSMVDPRGGRVMHVEGRGAMFEGLHKPVWLDPSIRDPRLKVIAGEVDFMVLRVEIPLVDGQMHETQPPADVDLSLLAQPRGTGSFLKGLLS